MNTPKMMVGQSLAVSMKPKVEADKENCFSTWKIRRFKKRIRKHF